MQKFALSLDVAEPEEWILCVGVEYVKNVFDLDHVLIRKSAPEQRRHSYNMEFDANTNEVCIYVPDIRRAAELVREVFEAFVISWMDTKTGRRLENAFNLSLIDN